MIFAVYCLVICSVIFLKNTVLCRDSEEPVCTSRFDYDHKMLQKMLLLELEQNKLSETVEQQSKEITKLEEKLKDEAEKRREVERKLVKVEDVASLDSTGVTYVRWGRTSCPRNGTTLVYKGYAGGSRYNQQGASSSYICLPENPTWNVYEDATQAGGTVWGAEYELVDRSSPQRFFGQDLFNRDVPCSVCHTKRQTLLMIPGRNICYDGWTLEYEGYLTAGHDSHNAADFACLDKEPEVLPGGIGDDDGKLFYFTEVRCGSLRCPPYINGRELTCVVCSV